MDWESWKQEHGKSYSEAEDAEKKRVWEATLAKVTAHNLKYDQCLVSYQLEMNKFAVEGPPLMDSPGEMLPDPTAPPFEEEFPATYLTSKPYMNYRENGWVTSVKDQGNCGSCYAFATAGVLEAQNKHTNGKLVSLSAQQLVDCSGNHGCDGGNFYKCFKFAKSGLVFDAHYRYKGKQGPCMRPLGYEVVVTNYWLLGREEFLRQALLFGGPAAVAIHIPRAFHLIKNDTDVFDSQEPGTGWHAVLVVGYGTNSKGVDYWIIKNSWGTGWGGGGYCLMKRGVNCCRIGDYSGFARVALNNEISQAENIEVETSNEN